MLQTLASEAPIVGLRTGAERVSRGEFPDNRENLKHVCYREFPRMALVGNWVNKREPPGDAIPDRSREGPPEASGAVVSELLVGVLRAAAAPITDQANLDGHRLVAASRTAFGNLAFYQLLTS